MVNAVLCKFQVPIRTPTQACNQVVPFATEGMCGFGVVNFCLRLDGLSDAVVDMELWYRKLMKPEGKVGCWLRIVVALFS